jgi:hypothetical protein
VFQMRSAKIEIGQVFTLSSRTRSSSADDSNLVDFLSLTRGKYTTGVNPTVGIWAYPEVQEPGQPFRRRPAIVLLSNPLTPNAKKNPWLDVIEPGEGYALYNGDNKSSKKQPFEPRGNKAIGEVAHLYASPTERVRAPPFLLFRQVLRNGKRSGYREFCGYGVPTRLGLRTQREVGGDRYFTNLVVELALFHLTGSDEELDWSWIDQRRDPQVSADEALELSPPAWRKWVREGVRAIEECRRRVVRDKVISREDQLRRLPSEEEVLQGIYSYYQHKRSRFEGLAARVAEGVIGAGCHRRWVTRPSRDGGVDFVCLLPLGGARSGTGVIILGQAKCVQPRSSIGPEALARLVARLRRGWIGVFVTTGTFSPQAQEEVVADSYPLVLINGTTLAAEVRRILEEDRLELAALLEIEGRWYESNIRAVHPSRALEELNFGIPIAFTDVPRPSSEAQYSNQP